MKRKYTFSLFFSLLSFCLHLYVYQTFFTIQNISSCSQSLGLSWSLYFCFHSFSHHPPSIYLTEPLFDFSLAQCFFPLCRWRKRQRGSGFYSCFTPCYIVPQHVLIINVSVPGNRICMAHKKKSNTVGT